jgi:SAM-dependent methyltransferase
MVDLTQLPAEEMARQLGNPQMELGVVVAEYMNRLNHALTEFAYRRLEVGDGHRVLEVGFGNGRLIPMLMDLAKNIDYAGVDISSTMVDAAIAANRGPVNAGRADIRLASVDALPFATSTFDRAIGINTLYFWPDPMSGLRELLRVLKPHGCLLLACISPETAATTRTMKAEFGVAVFSSAQIEDMHRAAGFASVTIEVYEEISALPDGTAFPRQYFLSRARP